MTDDLSSLRSEYAKASLDEKSVHPDPAVQYKKWLNEAIDAKLMEPTAMILATANPRGVPSQRTVLLKAFDEKGFVFYTNYSSKKAIEILSNNQVSLLFPWYGLERQVMVNGVAQKIDAKESLKYFISRPFGSQLGAWISHQSEVISSRAVLEIKLNEMKRKFKEGKVPLPDFWGGFRISPITYEFWQGRPSRLHDRIKYEFQDGNWTIARLAP